MSKTIIDLNSSSKEEALAKFKFLLQTTDHGKIDNSKPGKLGERYRKQDTVDGNPGAATKQCYPYSGWGGRTMGINGPTGYSGRGGYGD